MGPGVFLSVSLPFFLSLRLILWSVETRSAHSLAQASKTLSRRRTVPSLPREGTRCLLEQREPCIKDFIGFLCKPRNISLFLFLFHFLIFNSGPPGSSPLKDLNRTSWRRDEEKVIDFVSLGSKVNADSDFNHKIKRRLLLGRKVMTNLDSILKSRDITLPAKICLVKAMVFPVVMYGCELDHKES